MIRAFVSLALALALQALASAPALAVTFAECQAWLCLPGGFPPSECNDAKAAVTRRLAAFQPPLPPWSQCAAAFGWDMAVMDYHARYTDTCPHGGTPTNGTCHGTDANGCPYSYSAQKNAWVQVSVDGSSAFQPNIPHTQVTRAAGTPVSTDPLCPDPDIPPPPIQEQGNCQSVAGPGNPVSWYLVPVTCACPHGYPFTWPHSDPGRKYCLSNPGRP